jgi:rubrerythrin
MRKLTTYEFIEKAKKVHGDKYDYSKVEYVNSRTKICIICPQHGEFWQTPNAHLMKEGCPKCKGENVSKGNRHTTNEFIEKAKKVHGDKYDYSKVDYKNNSTKVCIICPIHGEFWQTPANHLQGCGCPICGIETIRKNNIGKKRNGGKTALSIDSFIEKAKKVHGDKYDYSKVKYTNNKTKVCIVCPIHGEFWQTPNAHLLGFGCYRCGRESMSTKQTKNTEIFIEEAKKVHGNKYDYSKVKYTIGNKKVTIICPIHGEYFQRPYNHLRGQGCPYCNESSLEKEINDILCEHNINFIKQCKKDTFGWLGKQSLDFYLPEYNIAIECQGVQHFGPYAFFGGDKGFYKQIERDYKKLKKCIEHNIKVLYYTNPSFDTLYEVITDKEELIKIITNEDYK